MSDNEKKREEEVFSQPVSDEEMTNATGGVENYCTLVHHDNCSGTNRREIYSNGFPNCAATVEAGSKCYTNDACKYSAVQYCDMKKCDRAWE